MPAVSVSIPAYNEEDIIGRTIENVLNQTFENFELLVIDDGSEDDTAAVVQEYTDDPRVEYIYQENQGFPGARNTGLDEGDGDYYAFIGADDIWEPEKLERQVEFAEKTGAGMVHSNAYHIDADDEITDVRWDECPPNTDDRRAFIRELFRRNFVCMQTVLVHDEHVAKRRFDEDLQIACDHDLWLRIGGEADVEYMDETLVRKRYDGGNISGNYERLFEERKRVVEKAVDRYPYLNDIRDQKLANIHLTYAINLIGEGDLDAGRKALKQAIKHDPTNWKTYGTYVLSLAGRGPVRSLAKEF